MSVRPAASLERRFSAPHAAGQGCALQGAGRDRCGTGCLSSTDAVGRFAGIPVVAEVVNRATANSAARKLLEKALGVHRHAPVPTYHSTPARKRLARLRATTGETAEAGAATRGKVLLYATCYGNRNRPSLAEDLAAVFEHNGIPVALAGEEVCCGMPKLELGDLEAVATARQVNIPELASWVDRGWDIVTPIPSCTLMYKQELPLMFPDEAGGAESPRCDVRSVRIPDASAP